MTYSKLTNVVMYSPNHSGDRTSKISKITIHHMAGNLTVEQCGRIFQGNRQASSNYGIGSDGRIACYVPEEYRSWASSSNWNDQQAITIEVANSTLAPYWQISDKAYASLIKLCADICNRYGINPSWTGYTAASLTEHRMYAATLCPGPYIHDRLANHKIEKDIKAQMTPSKDNTKIKNYVTLLYKNILGRNPDASGLNNWVNVLASKKQTAAQVVASFFNSAEYKSKKTGNGQYIADLYKGCLNRTHDMKGYQAWLSVLANKKQSRAQVLKGFTDSAEFKALIKKYGL